MDLKFTCISCRVAFGAADIQRQHYKTDWHRYNLKRKVAQLPPVSAEQFQKKVILQREKDSEEQKDSSTFCKVCRKSFSSGNAFENHLGSKKHRAGLSLLDPTSTDLNDISEPKVHREHPLPESGEGNIGQDDGGDDESDMEVEEVDSDEWDSEEEEEEEISADNPALSNDCLFCGHHSATLTKNINHMTLVHSFFLPDVEYLNDVRGLLLYLGEKVCRYNVCLWCAKSFRSLDAVRAHMDDKGHRKMYHEGDSLAEYQEFYNYATSYPDHQDAAIDIDQEVLLPNIVVDDSDYQLTLPSGATIGHRSLFLYYRQNLNPSTEVVVKKSKQKNRIISSYRSLGWTGTDKEAAVRKARDLDFIRRVQTKYATQLGVKANKLQKHFRPQVNF